MKVNFMAYSKNRLSITVKGTKGKIEWDKIVLNLPRLEEQLSNCKSSNSSCTLLILSVETYCKLICLLYICNFCKVVLLS